MQQGQGNTAYVAGGNQDNASLFDRRPQSALHSSADALAHGIEKAWTAEWGRRTGTVPLPVRWEGVDSALVQSWSSLQDMALHGPGWPKSPRNEMWAAKPGDLAREDTLAHVLEGVPTGRLIVLGAPGAGKTVLLARLVLDLLGLRQDGDAVPALVSLASWDPGERGLHRYVAHRLAADRALPGSGEDLFKALLEEKLITMVLDGLDEMRPEVRGRAITEINHALRPGERIIVACRSDAFEQTARPSSGSMPVDLVGAAAVKVRPLTGAEIARYLVDSNHGGPIALARWEPVTRVLSPRAPAARAQQPATGFLALALATPLMASLARVVYNPQHGEPLASVLHNPQELLAYRSREALEEGLFDAFIATAYQPRENPACRWQAEDATEWLTNLASYLQERKDGLAWWEIAGIEPRTPSGLTIGLLAGILGAIGLALPAAAGIVLIASVTTGLIARWLMRRWAKPENTRVTGPTPEPATSRARAQPRRRTSSRAGRRFTRPENPLAGALAGGLAGGLAGTVAAMLLFHPAQGAGTLLTGALAASLAVGSLGGFRAGLSGGLGGGFLGTLAALLGPDADLTAHLINGLGLGLAVGCAAGLARHRRPAQGVQWSVLGLGAGLLAGLVEGISQGLQYEQPARGLALGLVTATFAGPAAGREALPDLEMKPDPHGTLAQDRRTFWTTALFGGLAVGLSTGFGLSSQPGNGVEHGLEVGIVNTITVGLAFAFLRAAYGQFVLARWWLAMRGKLPWHLMTFLADAHETRGVLRQNGVRYQFRHDKLQQHLITKAWPERQETT